MDNRAKRPATQSSRRRFLKNSALGAATAYGLSVVGGVAELLIPFLPSNYGNHIRFKMNLELWDTSASAPLWEGSVQGRSKSRVRFAWQCRDIGHGTNDFDKVLSRLIQEKLPPAVRSMVAAAQARKGR